MILFSGIKPYLCDICGYGTNLRVKMDLHMATKHNEDKILAYVCEVCDYKCSNQLHLRAHLQIVHLEGLTPFECGVSISMINTYHLVSIIKISISKDCHNNYCVNYWR